MENLVECRNAEKSQFARDSLVPGRNSSGLSLALETGGLLARRISALRFEELQANPIFLMRKNRRLQRLSGPEGRL